MKQKVYTQKKECPRIDMQDLKIITLDHKN